MVKSLLPHHIKELEELNTLDMAKKTLSNHDPPIFFLDLFDPQKTSETHPSHRGPGL